MLISASQATTNAPGGSKPAVHFHAASRLELRSICANGGKVGREKLIIWETGDFGAQRIGRLRPELVDAGTIHWSWNITVPLIKPGVRLGRCEKFKEAYYQFRGAFEELSEGVDAYQWIRAFQLAHRARRQFNIL